MKTINVTQMELTLLMGALLKHVCDLPDGEMKDIGTALHSKLGAKLLIEQVEPKQRVERYVTPEIETYGFEFAHGKRPSGRGHWAFEFESRDDRGAVSNTVEFAPGTQLYSDAKKWARARARELNAFRVEVGS